MKLRARKLATARNNVTSMTVMDNLPEKIQATYERLVAAGCIREAMPVWDDDKRAITNSIARSAVFSVVEKGDRSPLLQQRVPAPSNY